MSETRTIPGEFPLFQGPATKAVAVDIPIGGLNLTHSFTKTTGFTAAVPLGYGPSQSEKWEILAFSVQVRLGVTLNATPAFQYWGKIGDLWAGILVDNPIPTPAGNSPPVWGPPVLPADMSTFTPVWSGDQDVAMITSLNADTESSWTLALDNLQLTFPLEMYTGAQLAFALTWTPSILDPCLAPGIKSCKYSVKYGTKGNSR